MSNEERPLPSALQAWASTVMSGSVGVDPEEAGAVDRAPGQAQYDPADVISVFMSARESARQRLVASRRPPRVTGR